MKIFTKTLSMILVLGIILSVFASCDNTGNEQQIEDNEKYKINVSITYATDDAGLTDVVEAMNVSGTTIMFDGENLSVCSEVVVGDTTAREEYVLVSDVLYRDMLLTVNGKTVTEKKKANLDEQKRQSLLADIGVGASIEAADFEDVSITESDGNTRYDCTGIKADSATSLEKILGSGLSSIGATVFLYSAEYSEVIQGDKIVESALSCRFSINLGGESYEITVNMNYQYDYTAEVSIVVPEGASDYTTVSYNEILK